MKRCSTIIREIQVKTKMNYHFTLPRMARNKKTVTSVGENVEKLEPIHTLENSPAVPQTIK
jgi:hypothetical protein